MGHKIIHSFYLFRWYYICLCVLWWGSLVMNILKNMFYIIWFRKLVFPCLNWALRILSIPWPIFCIFYVFFFDDYTVVWPGGGGSNITITNKSVFSVPLLRLQGIKLITEQIKLLKIRRPQMAPVEFLKRPWPVFTFFGIRNTLYFILHEKLIS